MMDKRDMIIREFERFVQEYSVEYTNYDEEVLKGVLELLKEQKPPTVRECKDLQVLRDIKSGKVLKSGCKDYVIYNGDWYRKHRWDSPEKEEPIAPVFTQEIEMDMSHWDCGACGAFILGNAYPSIHVENKPRYCGYCGRRLKWE